MGTERFKGALLAAFVIASLPVPAIATISLLSVGPVSTEGSIIKFTNSSFENWPMFHHDLMHTGYTTSPGPTDNHVNWTYTTGYVNSSPAVADGKVYIGSDDRNVYCLNANNGDTIWTYQTGYPVASSPAVADGNIYIGSTDGKVYCLNADNGDEIWAYQTGGQVFISSPAVADDKVYIGSWDNNVYCLNAENGDIIWIYQTGWHVSSSPAVAYDKVYIGSLDNNVYCLDADSGEKIWSYQTGSIVWSSPAVAYDKVYIGSYDCKVYCFGSSWTGTAVFSLVNLYTVNVEKNLYLENGSKLVVKFYTYGDVFKNENVIENFVPPWHVEENENARHPEGKAVKKVKLVLTYEDTENVISTLASFTVARDGLFGRVMEIKGLWPIALPDERDALFQEIMDTKGQWPIAPS